MTTSGLLAALIAGSLFSVSPVPDAASLDIATPPAIVQTVSADELLPETAWWTLFDDPILNACVEQAFRRNADLDMALARVEQARAVLRETKSAQYPTLDLNAGAGRGRVVMPGMGGDESESETSYVAGSINYEVDLFGRVRKGTAAALADWLATQSARDNVRLVLAADVARTYFNLICVNEQLGILRQTLRMDRETLSILHERFKYGKDSELYYQRFLAETASVEKQVKAYENMLAQNETAMLVLLGFNAGDMYPALHHRPVNVEVLPQLPEVPAGLPAEALNRRPDLMQARQQYVAAVARVGKADAERYPSLSLGFLLGSISGPVNDLFSGTTSWNLMGQLAAPIFDAGRRKSALQQAEAKAWEARANYEQTARVAFKEILNALVSRQKLAEQAEQLEIMRTAQSKTYMLATSQFEGGKIGQIDVLDAHRSLLQVELDNAGNRCDQLNAAVDLCLALGGGWNVVASDDLQSQPVKKRYRQQM